MKSDNKRNGRGPDLKPRRKRQPIHTPEDRERFQRWFRARMNEPETRKKGAKTLNALMRALILQGTPIGRDALAAYNQGHAMPYKAQLEILQNFFGKNFPKA